MTRFLTIIAMLCTFASTSALADHGDRHPTNYTEVCSVVAGDGVWSVYYHQYRGVACQQALREPYLVLRHRD